MAKAKDRRSKRNTEINTNHQDYYRPEVKLTAKNSAQRRYINTIIANDLIFCTGAPGSGKTFLAVTVALQALLDRRIEKIIITRPAVTAGEQLGYLPGELAEKFQPYLEPIEDTVVGHVGRNHYEALLKQEKITPKPLGFMRGVTFKDCFVLLDEAENTTVEQMRLFLTRIGDNCKVLINGDVAQQDIKGQNGLSNAVKLLAGLPRVGFHHFTSEDCVRSEMVRNILGRYEAELTTN